MGSFLQLYRDVVWGMVSGLDRIRFRGTLRSLAYVEGMRSFLNAAGVLIKDFSDFATDVTAKVRAASTAKAESEGRPKIYLPSSSTNKEATAKTIAEADGVSSGLVCILECVEPCWSYQVYRNRETKKIELRGAYRKCVHEYHYLIDPMFGWLNVRVQTWFPFGVHVCLNGREWLARRMDGARIGYVRRDNCFAWIEDIARAQRMFDQQLKVDWPKHLARLARQANPLYRQLPAPFFDDYYWSVDQSEWASDVMFRSAEDLEALYPHLLRHATETFGSVDVMRFLGRKIPAHGGVHGRFAGEIVSDLRSRPEGIRIKHRLGRNSIKMYDKQGSVLRVETTINDGAGMKVYRPKEGDESGPKEWRPLRKGVADLHRRAELSQAANNRYFEALAAADTPTPFGELVEPYCKPTRWNGKRVRALNPMQPNDHALLQAIAHGEFSINGFRNRDLRALLFGAPPRTKKVARRQSASITRQIRMLRAHGLVRKVAKSHRYQLTTDGRIFVAALLAAAKTGVDRLLEAA